MGKICIILVPFLFNNIYAWARPVEIDRSIHYHSTTRGFQRMVFKHEDVWFAFYSNGIDALYKTSINEGIDWSRATKIVSAANGSSSIDVILEKDIVYFFYVNYPGKYSKEIYEEDLPRTEVKKGKIVGRSILWEERYIIKGLGGYTAVTKNTNDLFYVISRIDDPEKKVRKVLFTRNTMPNDISSWEKPGKAINLEKDTNFASDIIALDGNEAYIIAKADKPGRLYGNFYDGKNWSKNDFMLSYMTNVAGDDRRMSAEFDSKNRKIHLVYVDRSCAVIYRTLSYPYRDHKWSPPLQIVSPEVHSAVLSIDEYSDPVNLVVAYGKFDGKSEQIYVKKFNEFSWSTEPILVSEGKGNQNLYPSIPRNFSDSTDLGVLYEKIEDNKSNSSIAVMFSVIDTACFRTANSTPGTANVTGKKERNKSIKEVTYVFPTEKKWLSSNCLNVSIDSKSASLSGKELPIRITWGREKRMLLSFLNFFGTNENQIPYGARIKKAVLSVKTSSKGTEGTVFFCRVTDPDAKGIWKEKGFWQSANWEFRNARNKTHWADLGQGGGTYFPNDMVYQSGMLPNTWYDIDVTSHLQAWSNGKPMQGWLIKNTYDDHHDLRIYSCDANVNNRPKLTITFEREE